MSIQPTQDRVIVKRDEKQNSKNGIILPTESIENANTGIVVAVGDGKYSIETGILMPMSVKVGDKVVFSKYGGQEVDHEGSKYLILRDDEIMGILEV